MLVAVAVVPHPPVLLPEVAGDGAPELAELRRACDRVVADLVRSGPDVVVVLCSGEVGRTQDHRVPASAAPYGLPGPTGSILGLGHTVGSRLLDRAGWDAERRVYRTVTGDPVDLPPGRVALLVAADGSARRSESAPGPYDPRAVRFDAAVARALAGGDVEALGDLDLVLADELWARGAPALRSLARTLRTQQGAAVEARVDLDAAPYGVGYLCASWTVRGAGE
ncbi:MAG: hypothetical protein Q7T56_16240 [Nocardioidaceae bacterium]|nr:hypothetical protein [Nocardioidaceae bacterium]